MLWYNTIVARKNRQVKLIPLEQSDKKIKPAMMQVLVFGLFPKENKDILPYMNQMDKNEGQYSDKFVLGREKYDMKEAFEEILRVAREKGYKKIIIHEISIGVGINRYIEEYCKEKRLSEAEKPDFYPEISIIPVFVCDKNHLVHGGVKGKKDSRRTNLLQKVILKEKTGRAIIKITKPFQNVWLRRGALNSSKDKGERMTVGFAAEQLYAITKTYTFNKEGHFFAKECVYKGKGVGDKTGVILSKNDEYLDIEAIIKKLDDDNIPFNYTDFPHGILNKK